MTEWGSDVPPYFSVHVAAPDLSPWLDGNTGVRGFTTFNSGRAGPHVAIVALVHGNELAGAVVLDAMLRHGVQISRGQLTLGFANLEAFTRFDPVQPTLSRFVDEDLNRVWDPALLDGPRRSVELDRARDMRPLIEQADMLLDLHSMLWPSDPLILSGPSDKGRDLAVGIAVPPLVVADYGHASGPRMIDYPCFTGNGPAAAVLVEAGQHWEADTIATTQAAVDGLLRHAGIRPGLAPQHRVRVADVTTAITATTSAFSFMRPFRGGDVMPHRNTLIALDGTAEIRTPHDDCMLVMPSLRASRGHTAVRLARFRS